MGSESMHMLSLFMDSTDLKRKGRSRSRPSGPGRPEQSSAFTLFELSATAVSNLLLAPPSLPWRRFLYSDKQDTMSC